MVTFRENYVVIIEPFNFNVHKSIMEYTTFEFVLGSRSLEFQEYIIELVSQYLELWQSSYRKTVLRDITSEVSHFLHSTIKNNTITIHTLCGLSVLAYYIAASQGKKMYLHQFTTTVNGISLYYTYFGVNDYTSEEILEKILVQTRDFQQEDKRTFFFIKTKDVQNSTKWRRSKQLNRNLDIFYSKKD